METAYQELATLQSKLPDTDIFSHGLILDFNAIINSAIARTRLSLEHLQIDLGDVIPSSGEFVGMRDGDPQFPITRKRFLEKLTTALQYFSKYSAK